MNDNIFKQIQQFINDFSSVPLQNIKINSKLERDLKIYGDDTLELIKAYSDKFNVNINSFTAKNFIAPEGDTIFPLILRLFTKTKPVERSDLTVLNLVNGVIAGKLDNEVITKEEQA